MVTPQLLVCQDEIKQMENEFRKIQLEYDTLLKEEKLNQSQISDSGDRLKAIDYSLSQFERKNAALLMELETIRQRHRKAKLSSSVDKSYQDKYDQTMRTQEKLFNDLFISNQKSNEMEPDNSKLLLSLHEQRELFKEQVNALRLNIDLKNHDIQNLIDECDDLESKINQINEEKVQRLNWRVVTPQQGTL